MFYENNYRYDYSSKIICILSFYHHVHCIGLRMCGAKSSPIFENTPVLTQDTLLFSSLALLSSRSWQCLWLVSFLTLFEVSLEQAGVVICLMAKLLN